MTRIRLILLKIYFARRNMFPLLFPFQYFYKSIVIKNLFLFLTTFLKQQIYLFSYYFSYNTRLLLKENVDARGNFFRKTRIYFEAVASNFQLNLSTLQAGRRRAWNRRGANIVGPRIARDARMRESIREDGKESGRGIFLFERRTRGGVF